MVTRAKHRAYSQGHQSRVVHMDRPEENDKWDAIIDSMAQSIRVQARERGITEHEMCWLMVKELGLDGKTITLK